MTIPNNLADIRDLIFTGQLDLERLVQHYLKTIEQTKDLNIYVEVFAQEALARARQLDRKFNEDPASVGKLFGAIISIKDVICYQHHRVSAASKILEDFESQFTASFLLQAIDEDVIIIGRTNCDEFAMGSTNEHSYYGPVKNGQDASRVPGGSSGGAAVSVQTHTCLLAVGSDTGGSVRQPAAWCGVIGLKPSYGRISRYGLIAYASSFDQIGIIGTNNDDILLFLSIIEGFDLMDSTSSDHQPTLSSYAQTKKSYSLVYFPEVLDHPKLNPQIKKSTLQMIEMLRVRGHKVREENFSLLDFLVPTYYVLTTAEASSNLNRYDGLRYGNRSEVHRDIHSSISDTRTQNFGIEVKRRIMMGTFVLSVGYFDAYFKKAQQVRRMICNQLDNILQDTDFIIMPTVTQLPPKLGESIKDPVQMYLADVFTVLANLSGLPAISIPSVDPKSQLSFGIQFISKKFQEYQLLTFTKDLSSMA